MRRIPTPLLLHIEFKFELEHANSAVRQITQSLRRRHWKCGHGKRAIAIVAITEESSLELVKRLSLDEITAIEDHSCYIAPIGAVCRHGSINSLHTALTNAWKEVGERRHPEYVRQTKRFDPRVERRVEDRESGAIREMRVELRGVGQPPKDTHRP